jgi:hypothetical protein
VTHTIIVKRYNPDQQRDPKGSKTGGRFTSNPAAAMPVEAKETTSVMFEVAPDPNDVELTEAWNRLSEAEKLEINRDIAEAMVPEVLKAVGADGRFEEQVGGYMGATNPSLALETDPSAAVSAAKLLGHTLAQDSMMVVSAAKAPGLDEVGIVGISIPQGERSQAALTKLYDRLYKLQDSNGDPLVGGFTASHGRMNILNFSGVPDAELAVLVDKQLGGRYSVQHTKAYAAFIDKKDYGYASGRVEGSPAVRREVADRLRRQATEAIQARLPGRKKADVYRLTIRRFNPDQPRAPEGQANGGQWVPMSGAGRGLERLEDGTPGGKADEWIPVHLGEVLGAPETREVMFQNPFKANDYYPVKVTAQKEGWDFHDTHVEEHHTARYSRGDVAAALSDYQGVHYRTVNGLARGQSIEEVEIPGPVTLTRAREIINTLETGLADGPGIPADTTVWRGFRNAGFVNEALGKGVVGQTFRDPGFMSTSVSGEVAKSFWSDKQYVGDGRRADAVVLRLRTVQKTPGLYLTGLYGRQPAEFEALIQRKTPFTVTKVRRLAGGGILVDADLG